MNFFFFINNNKNSLKNLRALNYSMALSKIDINFKTKKCKPITSVSTEVGDVYWAYVGFHIAPLVTAAVSGLIRGAPKVSIPRGLPGLTNRCTGWIHFFAKKAENCY